MLIKIHNFITFFFYFIIVIFVILFIVLIQDKKKKIKIINKNESVKIGS